MIENSASYAGAHPTVGGAGAGRGRDASPRNSVSPVEHVDACDPNGGYFRPPKTFGGQGPRHRTSLRASVGSSPIQPVLGPAMTGRSLGRCRPAPDVRRWVADLAGRPGARVPAPCGPGRGTFGRATRHSRLALI